MSTTASVSARLTSTRIAEPWKILRDGLVSSSSPLLICSITLANARALSGSRETVNAQPCLRRALNP
jgi:hypothetical protein